MKKMIILIKLFFLSMILAKKFQKDLCKVMFREEKETGYLNQKDFSGIRERAKAGLAEALPRTEAMLTVAIGSSRTLKYDEDHSSEINSASKILTTGEVKSSTAKWWVL